MSLMYGSTTSRWRKNIQDYREGHEFPSKELSLIYEVYHLCSFFIEIDAEQRRSHSLEAFFEKHFTTLVGILSANNVFWVDA